MWKRVTDGLGGAKGALLNNRSVSQTIIKNTFWLSVSEFIGRFLRMGIIIYAARVLGAAGWGTLSYVMSMAAIFTIFSDIGLSSVMIRQIAKEPEKRAEYLSASFTIKAVVTGFSFLFMVFGMPLFTGIELSNSLVIAAALLFLFDSLRRFGSSVFRAEERMELEAFTNIATQIAILAVGFAALTILKTPESLAGAYAIGGAVGLLITVYMQRGEIKTYFAKPDRALIRKIISAAWPLSLATIFGVLLVNMDTVMIGWFFGADTVGYYSAAQKPIALLYILPTLIVGGVFPALARYVNDKETFRRILEKGLWFIMLAAFPISIGIFLTADQIVNLIYGVEYAPAAGALRILSLTILSAFPSSMLINSAFAHKKEKSLIHLWIIGIVMNALLNIAFIPRMGISGAAWASLITQIAINGAMWRKVRAISPFSIAKKMNPIFLASFMMATATILMRQFGAAIFIVIPVAAAAYVASLSFSKENILGDIRTALREGK